MYIRCLYSPTEPSETDSPICGIFTVTTSPTKKYSIRTIYH